MSRRVLVDSGRIIAVVLAFGLSACGSPSDEMMQQGAAQSTAPLHAVSELGRDEACEAIYTQLRRDGEAMQATPQFRALSDIPEFTVMVKDLHNLRAKRCDLSLGRKTTALCRKLRKKALKDQLTLAHTQQFIALAKTSQFEAVLGGMREAAASGCLGGMDIKFEADALFAPLSQAKP